MFRQQESRKRSLSSSVLYPRSRIRPRSALSAQSEYSGGSHSLSLHVRNCVWPVMMARKDGSIIEFVDDLAADPTPRRNVTNNFKMRFALTPEMESLLLSVYGLVAVTGPSLAIDVFGHNLFEDTTYISQDEDTITRLFRTTLALGAEPRVARWRDWSLQYGRGPFVLDHLIIRTPKSETPFAQLPSGLQDQLMNPEVTHG